MQGAVRRMSPLFPPLHFPLIFFPPSVRPWGNASVHQVFKPTLVVGRTCSFCGVQCVHSCADPFLMLEEGALVSFPICHQKHSSKFRSILSPPPPSSFSLPTLLLLLPCKHSDLSTAWSAAWRHSKLSSQSTPKEIFHPGAGVEFYPAMPHCTTPLHCTA